MLKGKNLLLLALVGGGAYLYWMKMKKDEQAKVSTPTTSSENNWTGSYFNASGSKAVVLKKAATSGVVNKTNVTKAARKGFFGLIFGR